MVNQSALINMTIINPFELPFLPLAWKSGLPKCPAVYFAIHKKQILYIGSTKNLNNRWSNHNKVEELKAFGTFRIAWYETEDSTILGKLEGEAIRAYKPSLNIWKRNRGEGSGHLRKRIVTKKGSNYEEHHYHYEQ